MREVTKTTSNLNTSLYHTEACLSPREVSLSPNAIRSQKQLNYPQNDEFQYVHVAISYCLRFIFVPINQ